MVSRVFATVNIFPHDNAQKLAIAMCCHYRQVLYRCTRANYIPPCSQAEHAIRQSHAAASSGS
eukprot:7380013-Karenia_brevis.AAC.1